MDMNHANWIELAGIHGGLWLMTDANVVDVNPIFFCLKIPEAGAAVKDMVPSTYFSEDNLLSDAFSMFW